MPSHCQEFFAHPGNLFGRNDRTIHCEWFNTTIIGPAGEVLGVSSFCADITNRVNLENQLRQSQKMQAVGQLAAGVAHNFNNLLTAVLGYTELLLARTTLPGDREDLTEIQKAGHRAAALTRQARPNSPRPSSA